MDPQTPSKTLEGGEQITILSLLANDTDQEMSQMSDHLEGLLGEKGLCGGRVDCTTDLPPFALVAPKIYVTGHCRYMESNSSIRPIEKRTLGGFKLKPVAMTLADAILNGTTEIELWCCESGCKRSTKNLEGGKASTFCLEPTWNNVLDLKTSIQNQAASEVSTVEVLCCEIVDHLVATAKEKPYMQRKISNCQNVKITSLNGVGYLTSDDGYITTFDQGAALHTLNKIIELEKKENSGDLSKTEEKSLQSAQMSFARHIKSRKCHFITHTLNFKQLFLDRWATNELAKEPEVTAFLKARAVDERQKLDASRQKLSADRLNQIGAQLGPVFQNHGKK